MTHLRLRHWGSADWTDILIDGELEDEALQIVGGPLSNASGDFAYHVQRLNEDGEWEDLE